MGETIFFVHDQLGLSADIRSDGSSWASRNLLSFFANWMPSGPVAHYHRQITFQGIYRNQMWEQIAPVFPADIAISIFPRDFAVHRGATVAATTSASVRRSMSYIQEQPTEGVRPNATVTRGAGSGQHLASVLQEAGKTRTWMPVWDSFGESR